MVTRPRARAGRHHRHGDVARGRTRPSAQRATAWTHSWPPLPSTPWAARRRWSVTSAPSASTPTCHCSPTTCPVCVHTKLDPTMLVRLGKDGVLQGVKDSSGDDVSFRWLCIENEEAGHPLQLLTGHEVVRRRRLHGRCRRQRAGPGQHRPGELRGAVARLPGRRLGEASATLQDHLARLMFVTREVKATVGFGAGVGAFKTALWQMGVFNTNQMREPVQAARGRGRGRHIVERPQAGRPHGRRRAHARVHLERLPRLRLLGVRRGP